MSETRKQKDEDAVQPHHTDVGSAAALQNKAGPENSFVADKSIRDAVAPSEDDKPVQRGVMAMNLPLRDTDATTDKAPAAAQAYMATSTPKHSQGPLVPEPLLASSKTSLQSAAAYRHRGSHAHEEATSLAFASSHHHPQGSQEERASLPPSGNPGVPLETNNNHVEALRALLLEEERLISRLEELNRLEQAVLLGRCRPSPAIIPPDDDTAATTSPQQQEDEPSSARPSIQNNINHRAEQEAAAPRRKDRKRSSRAACLPEPQRSPSCRFDATTAMGSCTNHHSHDSMLALYWANACRSMGIEERADAEGLWWRRSHDAAADDSSNMTRTTMVDGENDSGAGESVIHQQDDSAVEDLPPSESPAVEEQNCKETGEGHDAASECKSSE